MSGIEIAGLVLGALPLIISAVEHYESSLDRVKAFWKWESELERALQELWIEHSYYEMTLKTLLKDVTNGPDLEEMMSNPDSPLWKGEELADELENKLGVAYNVYVHTIKEMELHIKILSRALDIDRQPTSTNELEAILRANRPLLGQSQGPPKFEFKRRIKFNMKRKDIRRLLKDLKDCNTRLEKFIEKAEKMDQSTTLPKKKSSRSKMTVPLEQIHEYAARLHYVLSKAWGDCSHHSHSANLLLEDRMVWRQRKGGLSRGKDSAPTFIVFFGSPSTPKSWHMAEVQVVKEVNPGSNTGSKVKFAVSSPSGSAPVHSLSEKQQFADLKLINDLCAILHNRDDHTTCHGFCLDLRVGLRGTFPVLNPKQTVHITGDLVTLEDLLFSKSTDWQPLTEEDRYVLAITLASSFLQLHRTPWLGTLWSKRGILFTEAASKLNRRRIDVRHPLVRKTYEETNTITNSSTIYNVSTISTHEDNINLLTLAKLLLEIRFGTSIESLRRNEDLGPGAVPNEATDLQALQRWIVEEQENLSFAFRDAVSYCMKCFADPFTDLQKADTRQGVVDSVVVPLLEELHFWRNGPLVE